MKAKIYIFQSLTRAFGEITHREEVARKGFARGKNINMYDAGEKVGKMVLKRMRKWKEERDHYKALFQARKTLESQDKEEQPGPNTRCHGCKTIPDSRLRSCGKCHKAYYCKIECQKKAWRQHRIQCRLDGPPTNPNWPV